METKELLLRAIELANTSYQTGEPIEKSINLDFEFEDSQYICRYQIGDYVDDFIYDEWVRMLKILDPTFIDKTRIGYKTQKEREVKLPLLLPSIIKKTSFADFSKWADSIKSVYGDIDMVISPKMDGCSGLTNCKLAYTGGGHTQFGTDISVHMNSINKIAFKNQLIWIKGEILFSKSKFAKYSKKNGGKYKNGRNTIAGKLRDLQPDKMLADADFIAYDYDGSFYDYQYKHEAFHFLNNNQPNKIPFTVVKISEISEDFLNELFYIYKETFDYDIDGLIVEVDDFNILHKLGSNSDSELFGKIAYKGNFEDEETTIITNITYQVSKHGLMKPVVHFESVELNGAEIGKCYGDNGRFLKIYDVAVGQEVKIKRAGMVIPRISEVNGITVLNAKEMDKFINEFDNDIEKIKNKLGVKTSYFADPKKSKFDGVEFITDSSDFDSEIQHQKVVAFFEALEVDGVSDGIITEFFEHGYNTVASILKLTEEELASWDGWGAKRANNILTEIKKKTQCVALEKLQHASTLFSSIGSERLSLLVHLDSSCTLEDVMKVDGFGEKLANIYIDNIKDFWRWASELDITISKESKNQEKTSNKCLGWAVCFTGFRDKDLENKIKSAGGEIKSSVSKKTTHLVMKEKGSGSNKESDAIKLGIKIFSQNEFVSYLEDNENW